MEQGEPSVKRQKPSDNGEGSENENENVAVGADAIVAEGQDLNEENNQNEIAAIAVPNEPQMADILKLDIDCFDEAFDYLPFQDLISVGKTCKRLQQVAGYCFNRNYRDVYIVSISNGLEARRYSLNMNHLIPFMRRIECISLVDLNYVINIQSKLRRLKQISIRYMEITQAEIDCMTEILGKLEDLRMESCHLNLREIIAQCPKLRRLNVERCESDLNWLLLQKCPTLEYFKFFPRTADAGPIEQITMFLQLNPSVQKFVVKADFLWANRDLIKNTSGIKLNDLVISYENPDLNFVALCDLLRELQEGGFYKRLHLYNRGIINQEKIDQLAMIDAFVKLSTYFIGDLVTLSPLKNLEELSVYDGSMISNAEKTAKDLVNLKRIHFMHAELDCAIPFIKQSVEMEKIKIDNINNIARNIVDLPALNKLREKLPDPQKIILYAREEIYLATKWALKETNFPFICLKRVESFEWNHDVGCSF